VNSPAGSWPPNWGREQDYRLVFEVAKKSNIKHYFIEQEAYDMPPMEALKIDADYMKKLNV